MCLLNPISYQELLLVLTGVYLLTALYYFTNWFIVFKQETSLSSTEKGLLWGVLVLGTLLWPIVVPLSQLEKQTLGQQPF
ncbi:MAG TPA: hypothetical protein V6D14_29815 [Coleofasciculaceae cyanobacterium]|jgi:type VI protein secretion system component VasK